MQADNENRRNINALYYTLYILPNGQSVQSHNKAKRLARVINGHTQCKGKCKYNTVHKQYCKYCGIDLVQTKANNSFFTIFCLSISRDCWLSQLPHTDTDQDHRHTITNGSSKSAPEKYRSLAFLTLYYGSANTHTHMHIFGPM